MAVYLSLHQHCVLRTVEATKGDAYIFDPMYINVFTEVSELYPQCIILVALKGHRLPSWVLPGHWHSV